MIHKLYNVDVPGYAYSRCVNEWGWHLMVWNWRETLSNMPYFPLWELADQTGLFEDHTLN